ncbi:MAG: glutamate-5-semialdehyde dehydrogenase [Acetanaerobacterium sp.]
MTVLEIGKAAKTASRTLMTTSTARKNAALTAIAQALEDGIPDILRENAADLASGEAAGLTKALLDRLRLTEERVRAIAAAVREVVMLPDPIGRIDMGFTNANELRILKTRVPLGVIAIIYEARPNVTVDAAALCLKSSNAVILRGGKEALRSNLCLVSIMRAAVEKTGLCADCIQIIRDTARETATELMRLDGYVDVLIPRGGAGLIAACVKNATVPVIETGVGNCHVYVDSPCDLAMAAAIIDNAKTTRPSVCNSAETLLVHEDVAQAFLPMANKLLQRSAVELRGCARTREILGDGVIPATDEDYATEFSDYILAVKVVASIDEAIAHIVQYTSGHSECIVTDSLSNSERFTSEIDAAAVYVNASTRFTDGGMFGLGAEIGISTQKLHTRGPMGLNELTSVKYVIHGSGQVR